MTTGSAAGDDQADPAVRVITGERRQLVSLAYRLLGSLADAEDAVQEACARWYGLPEPERAAIASPGAWLTRVTSRVCLSQLGSARARRESYVGDWIPEPLPGSAESAVFAGPAGPADDPADRVTLDESVSMAFLVVLESMTPAERVAFVLHDVFRYPFAEVAAIVGRSPAACRQLATSARRRVGAARVTAAPAGRQAPIVRDFKQAWQAHDIAALVSLLDPGATATADGGGVVSAVARPVEGAEQIARACVELARRPPGLTILERTVNGQPGLVSVRDGNPVAVLAFAVDGDRITRIWAVLNPEKLRAWADAGGQPGAGRTPCGARPTPRRGCAERNRNHPGNGGGRLRDRRRGRRLAAGRAVPRRQADLARRRLGRGRRPGRDHPRPSPNRRRPAERTDPFSVAPGPVPRRSPPARDGARAVPAAVPT